MLIGIYDYINIKKNEKDKINRLLNIKDTNLLNKI